MKPFGVIGIILVLASVNVHAAEESSLAFDSSLGFTSNANLTDTGAEADQMFKLGGVYRFPAAAGRGRFSLGVTDYFKRHENDLLSADLGTVQETYGVRLSLRNYLHQDVGTTDQAFTHYGVIGNLAWSPKTAPAWKFSPTTDIEYYPGSSRTDFEFYFRASYDPSPLEPIGGFHFSVSPGLLVSTRSDFSKMYLSLSGGYEKPISDTADWGVDLTISPQKYFSRSTTSTVLAGRGKKAGAVAVTEMETTLFFSPEFWVSKILSSQWEARGEVFARFQSSKSGSYNYNEFQTLGSLRYRLF